MAVFASSNFNGTEGDLLSTFDANWIKQSGSTGNAEIASSRARASSTTTALYYYNAAPASADYTVSVQVVSPGATTGSTFGPVARAATGANTSYHARYNSAAAAVQLFKFVAGTATQLGSVGRTTLSSAPLVINVSGSTIEATWNGEATPLISVTDTSITSAGFPGLRWNTSTTPTDTTGWQAEDFSADQAGGTTHTATGAIVGAGSTVAGTASSATTHTAFGALVGAGSTLSGSASRTAGFTTHTAAGTLLGAGSVLAGSANRTGAPTVHTASGALLAVGSALSGAAQHLALHTSTGALSGAGSVLAGSASRVGAAVTHTASGALVGPGSLLNGAGQVGDVLIDTHDGFWAKEWKRIRAREKRKYQEEIQERVEEIQDEIAEVEQQIVEVKQAPKPKNATPARDFYAEQARIVEHLIARRNQLIDEEDEELLLLL